MVNMQFTHSYANRIVVLSSLLLHIIQYCGTSRIVGPNDFCTSDKFEPTCGEEEVVVIETAVYGRMKAGKCFQQEEGNFGCLADVKNILDYLCSGRQSCSVPTFNNELFATKPCGPSTIGYLSVSYSCLKVTMVRTQCSGRSEITLISSTGYLSTNSQSTKGHACPVSIEIPNGRRMKFAVYNFMKKSGSACYEIAVIKEKDNQKSVHVCQSDSRTKEVMMTSSSHVTVHFSDFQTGESMGGFLLQYEATGCAQPIIPAGAHFEREGDRVKIKCNNSDSSWFIYCKDDMWTEMDRKCPEDWGISKIFKTESGGFPYGIFLTSFIAVGIGIFLGGFLLFIAINAFQRHQRRLRRAYESPPIIPDPDYKIYDTCKMDLNFVPGFGTAGRHTIARHQMSPPPVPSQPPEDERRFSRHTYEKPKYNSTDNSPFVES